MSFIPIIVMNLVLLVITVLLAIADRLIVNYGECKITITQEEERKEFVVRGGDSLLANLTENKIDVSSSCAGKATCGYCKVRVLSGAGPILPTEEIFISREEKAANMRLACQVKVKNDIEIHIPDYLTTVKSIVKNQLYDTRLSWRFIMGDETKAAERTKIKLPTKNKMEIERVIEGYKDMAGSLVPVLQKVNDTFNYLPEPVLRSISEKLNIPLSLVYRIATFYNAFSLQPRGKYVITVCLGTACHVKGAGDILAAFEERLGIKAGETTEDMLFTLEGVRCIGCCGLAPVLKINEDVHGLVTKKSVPKLIESCGGD